MTKPKDMAGKGMIALALGAAATAFVAMPSAGLALGDSNSVSLIGKSDFAVFTPANVDPQLAKRVATSIREKGLGLSFTPGNSVGTGDRTVTVAVRVDDQTARAISIRSAAKLAQAQSGESRIAIAPTRYNLGIARGYQSFAKAKAPEISTGLGSVQMPDLAEFKPAEATAPKKPSRFQPRISLQEETKAGRTPGTLDGLGEQSFDLGGAYRVTKNLNVTAGVRLSQERDRLDPLTDNVQDSQAVYVGTQFRF